jgi:hypothetical protein
MGTFEWIFLLPSIIGTIYTKLSPQHRRAKAIIERYIYQMIDNETADTQESIAQRKRACLIASLVASLQENEEAEAKKSENEKKGKTYVIRVRLLVTEGRHLFHFLKLIGIS